MFKPDRADSWIDPNRDGVVDHRECEECVGDGEVEESGCGAEGHA